MSPYKWAPIRRVGSRKLQLQQLATPICRSQFFVCRLSIWPFLSISPCLSLSLYLYLCSMSRCSLLLLGNSSPFLFVWHITCRNIIPSTHSPRHHAFLYVIYGLVSGPAYNLTQFRRPIATIEVIPFQKSQRVHSIRDAQPETTLGYDRGWSVSVKDTRHPTRLEMTMMLTRQILGGEAITQDTLSSGSANSSCSSESEPIDILSLSLKTAYAIHGAETQNRNDIMTHSRKRNESLTVASPRPMTPTEDTESSVGSPSPREPNHIGVPDGGRRAWLVVLGGFINFTASFGILGNS